MVFMLMLCLTGLPLIFHHELDGVLGYEPEVPAMPAGTAHVSLDIQALLVSQPLHFGDYGGLPLKIVRGLLDLATIVVLANGLYLWIARRRWKTAGERVQPGARPSGAGAAE